MMAGITLNVFVEYWTCCIGFEWNKLCWIAWGSTGNAVENTVFEDWYEPCISPWISSLSSSCRKILACRICRMIRMLECMQETAGFNLYVLFVEEMQIQPLFWHHAEYWMCCTGFKWNKHRCTYVHWRIYSSRYLDTLLYKVEVIWNGNHSSLYTNATID